MMNYSVKNDSFSLPVIPDFAKNERKFQISKVAEQQPSQWMTSQMPISDYDDADGYYIIIIIIIIIITIVIIIVIINKQSRDHITEKLFRNINYKCRNKKDNHLSSPFDRVLET